MGRTSMLVIVAGLLVAGCGQTYGPTPEPIINTRGEISAIMVPKGPSIDGTLKDPIWQKCPPLVLGDCQSDRVGVLKATARVLFDPTNLYVAWDCVDPDTAGIKADVANRDGNVWEDDCVELFISPDPKVGYYHFIINSRGTLRDGHGVLGGAGDAEDASWNSTAVVKTSVEKKKGWIVTMSVPLKELGAYVGDKQTWAMNLNRTKPGGDSGVRWIESSWSAKGTSTYADNEGWGKIVGVRIVSRPDGVTKTAPEKK